MANISYTSPTPPRAPVNIAPTSTPIYTPPTPPREYVNVDYVIKKKISDLPETTEVYPDAFLVVTTADEWVDNKITPDNLIRSSQIISGLAFNQILTPVTGGTVEIESNEAVIFTNAFNNNSITIKVRPPSNLLYIRKSIFTFTTGENIPIRLQLGLTSGEHKFVNYTPPSLVANYTYTFTFTWISLTECQVQYTINKA